MNSSMPLGVVLTGERVMDKEHKEELPPNPIFDEKAAKSDKSELQGKSNIRVNGEFQTKPNNFPRRDVNDNRPRLNNYQGRSNNRNFGENKPNSGGRDFRDNKRFVSQPSFTDRKSFEERKKAGEIKPFSERKNFTPRTDYRGGTGPVNRGGFKPSGFKPTGFKPGGKFQPSGKFQPRAKNAPKAWEINPPKIVSEMQLTEGKHRGKYLKTTESKKVRPTTRRIREVMFRLIYRRVKFSRFLDLCAGSGMVGLEALSRGAVMSTFVERSSKMCSFIKKNLEAVGVKDGHCEVEEIEAAPFLKHANKKKRQWDVVFFDPPYDSNYEEVLELLGKGYGLSKKGCVVLEHHSDMFFPEKVGCLNRFKVIVNGETALSFFERR
jgi:16S rRNA (guanine966-N2)-methyltransferase